MRQRTDYNELMFGHWSEMGALWGDYVFSAQKYYIETEQNMSAQ